MSRYGLQKAPRARKKKSGGILVWFLLLAVAGLIAWIWWGGAREQPKRLSPRTNTLPDTAKKMITNTTPVIALITNAPLPSPPTNQPVTQPSMLQMRTGPVRNYFEAQIALARQGISPGSIDGSGGLQTRAALRAFQLKEGLPQTGDLDLGTKGRLVLTEPAYSYYIVTSGDLQNLAPVPETWQGKSEKTILGYENLVELVAEKAQASPGTIQVLNPQVDWDHVSPGSLIKIPWIMRKPFVAKAAFVRILLREKVLQVYGSSSNLLAHFPCSIAKKVEKRPVGRLTVARIALNPNYLFDPEIFPESAEARKIDHKLVLPPGPNNPVGVAWIGLDKPGYGIHGSPKPEQIGRTESHGCFRLANWNAQYLAQMVWVGMPVYVEP